MAKYKCEELNKCEDITEGTVFSGVWPDNKTKTVTTPSTKEENDAFWCNHQMGLNET